MNTEAHRIDSDRLTRIETKLDGAITWVKDIKKDVDDIKGAIHGSNGRGIKTRLSLLEDRERTRRYLFGLLWAAIIAITAALIESRYGVAMPTYVGEEQTTHRAGDIIPYAAGCWKREDAIEVASSDGPDAANEAFDKKRAEDKCFLVVNNRGEVYSIPAQLEEWVSGPHDAGMGNSGSVWRALDISGDTIYLFMLDHTGPHPKAKSL